MRGFANPCDGTPTGSTRAETGPRLACLSAFLALPLVAQTLPDVASSQTSKQAGEAPAQKAAPDDFAQTDLNHDGRISASEYAASPQSAIDRIAAGKRRGPAGITGGFDLANNEGNPERSRFFRRLDLNGDGSISREEWGKAEQPTAKPKQ